MDGTKVVTISGVKPAPGNLLSVEFFYKGSKTTLSGSA